MEAKSSATSGPSIRLTPEQINTLLAEKLNTKERGAKAAYARRIRRHRSTVKRIIEGDIRGDLRKRFAKFLCVSEDALPEKAFVR